MKGRWLRALVLALALGLLRRGHRARAEVVKVLVLKGADDATNTAGVTAIKALGTANELQRRRGRRRRGHQRRPSSTATRRWSSSTSPATCSTPSGRRRCSASSRTATASSASAPPRPVEPGASFVNGLIGARPDATARRRRRRRPSSPATACTRRRATCRCCGTAPTSGTRGDAPDRHGAHRRALPRARTRRPATARRSAAPTPDLLVPRLPRRPLLLHRHGPHRGGVRRGRLQEAPARRARVDRRPHPRRLQGDDQRQLQGHQAHERRPDGHRPRHQRRVARPRDRQQRLGDVHRPRRLPHRRRARRAARPAVARPHPRPLEPERRHRLRQRPHLRPGAVHRRREQRRHARRQARRLRRRRPGRRAHQRGRPQDGVRPARHHRRRRTSPPRVTSTCSTSRPSTRPARRPACRSSAASRRCRARASRASRSTSRRRSSTSSSEVGIFEYDAQIYSCCHVGGGMGFDSEGNLYVTTGDTNSSQGSNGYSGNNPIAKCPTGRQHGPVERATAAPRTTPTRTRAGPRATPTTTTARCCASSRSRRIPDGAKPTVGVGTTYTLPTADSPERPEPVQRRRGRRRHRPSPRSTRWACATRAACRSTRRPTCRTRRGSARTPAPRA